MGGDDGGGGRRRGGRVEVIDSKGCSRLFVGLTTSMPSFRGLSNLEPMSPLPSFNGSGSVVQSNGPFSGLVICVTGLSKEAREQVMEATERLGGQYSPNLHPQCTHLVVQNFNGRKFEHALKHGSKNGLIVVTLGWFVDSVRRNVRLSESLYSIKGFGDSGIRIDELNRIVGLSSESSCLPAGINDAKEYDMGEVLHKYSSGKCSNKGISSPLSGELICIDSAISDQLRNKVSEAARMEGATVLESWFVGSSASYVVCDEASVQRYLGHCNNVVTPLWMLKTVKEQRMQRLVHISADLARQVGLILENHQHGLAGVDLKAGNVTEGALNRTSQKQRQQIVDDAKNAVKNRRGRRMQTCQTPIRPITPRSLLDSICWCVSEPTSAASIYTDSFSSEDGREQQTTMFYDAKGDGKELEASFSNLMRPLTETEKSELVFKNHFLTILFPIDRFSEMGPSSRTFFSDNGFTCIQVLDHIHAFYQENMSASEVEAAIHTDSRHADRIRAVYSSKETAESGLVIFKRIDFLGSRKSFELLKRVSGDNSSNVYELLIRA